MKRMLFITVICLAGCTKEPSLQTRTFDPQNTATEKLVQTTPPEWWQPTEVIDHGDGSSVWTWSSGAAKDEYDRRQRLQEAAAMMNLPDDPVYVFDDTYSQATGLATIDRQDNGGRNKLGIAKKVSTDFGSLMPQFQQIAADNANRLAAFTGPRLAAVQAIDPHYWNVSIESVKPIANGLSIVVLVSCGSREKGSAAFIDEEWSYVDNQLTLVSRAQNTNTMPNSY
jgi:hypothetical protein